MKYNRMRVNLSRWVTRFWLAGAAWAMIEIVARCVVFRIEQDPLLVAVESLVAGLLAWPVAETARELMTPQPLKRVEEDLFWHTIDEACRQGRLHEITPYLDPRIRDSIIHGGQVRRARRGK